MDDSICSAVASSAPVMATKLASTSELSISQTGPSRCVITPSVFPYRYLSAAPAWQKKILGKVSQQQLVAHTAAPKCCHDLTSSTSLKASLEQPPKLSALKVPSGCCAVGKTGAPASLGAVRWWKSLQAFVFSAYVSQKSACSLDQTNELAGEKCQLFPRCSALTNIDNIP